MTKSGTLSPISGYIPSVISVLPSEEDEKLYQGQPAHAMDTNTPPKEGKAAQEFVYPDCDTVPDPRRYLTSKEILVQRSFFIGVVFLLNLGMAIAAFVARRGIMVLVFMVLIKSKDVLSCFIQAFGLPARWFKHRIWGQPEITSKAILSLIPAYSESEEQIVKTTFSLRDNRTDPHWQVMCHSGRKTARYQETHDEAHCLIYTKIRDNQEYDREVEYCRRFPRGRSCHRSREGQECRKEGLSGTLS